MDENKKRKKRIDRKKRSTEALEKVMSNFTDDLWTEILLHLPIKSLLQFKSVSKSWLSIISSHRFAKSHLETAAKDDQVLIVHQEPGDLEQNEDGCFSLLHLGSGRIFENLKFPYSQGEYSSDYIYSTLIGSDCGIVFVSVDISDWPATKKNFDLYLWNPATKHSKVIPPYSVPDDDDCKSGALGFGFDHVDLDFKVVKVIAHNLSAKVYSSNKNNWQNIQPKPIDVPQNNTFDVCLHGFLLAIGSNSGMMAFNLNKELFICDINLPVISFDDAEISIKTRVNDFKDTISVIICNMKKGKIQLWTLDDEACLCGGGVKASWTKVLSVDLGVPLHYVEGLFNSVQFSLINADGDRFLYDLNKKVVTYGVPYLENCEIFKYTGSLFSLEGFKRIKWAASSSTLQDSSDSDVETDE